VIKRFKTDDTSLHQMFWCPGCGHIHAVDQRWTYNGNAEKPTISPSYKLWHPRPNKPDFVCHSFIRDGKIEFCSDSTHSLSGKTVDLPDFDTAAKEDREKPITFSEE
jgi:hypothetical protein